MATSPDRIEPIVIEEQEIRIDAPTVEEILAVSGLTQEALQDLLPLGLGRGVPRDKCVHETLIREAEAKLAESELPRTYKGTKHPDVPEKNSFRGEAVYINNALRSLSEDFGLDGLHATNITSGNGAQEIVKATIEMLIREESPKIFTTERTFDRTLRNIGRSNKGRNNPTCAIEGSVNDDAFISTIVKEFRNGRRNLLFMVPFGSNPDGESIEKDRLKTICTLARERNSRIVLDCAYSRLHLNDEDKLDLSWMDEFIQDGTVTLVFTSTKEGGERHGGLGYAVGSPDMVNAIRGDLDDQRLSPNYKGQIEQVIFETLDSGALSRYGFDDVMTLKEFLKRKVRPELLASWNIVRSTMAAAGIQLSNPDVKHGYNVSVLLPETAPTEKHAQFFATLKGLGVNSLDLSPFSAGEPVPGFRIPFGGFSPQECHVFCTLIVKSYKEVYG